MQGYEYYAQEPTERQSSSVKKRKLDAARRGWDRRRQKSRINIGVDFSRWKALMQEKCFQSDADVACFLQDRQVSPTLAKEFA